MTGPLLDIRDLRLSIGQGVGALPLLRKVSLTVAPGEAVGIVGESGSGKTLTVRSVIGMLPPGATLEGDVVYDGTSVPAMSGRELTRLRRDEIGMVFQDPHASVNPVHRIGDFLTETYRRQSRRDRRAAALRARELLRRVQIKDPDRVLESFPHQLSGGMLQRVMIAAAVLREPRLLLADEPTTALDVTTQAEVLGLLDEIRRERGAAMVFITHDIEVVAAICDRVVVMYGGRVVEELTPGQLHAGQISEPYTEALLACRPDIRHRRDRLPDIPRGKFDEKTVVS
jgi:oligopeptide transport system ATP-binding protein